MALPITAPTAAPTPRAPFTPAEQRALRLLRARYAQDRDLFGSAELERLRFLRWLYHTGRLAP